MSDEEYVNDYPLYLYEYDASGRYGKPIDIPTELGLRILMGSTVKAAIEEKREVRITDGADNIVFHAKDGRILWPPGDAR